MINKRNEGQNFESQACEYITLCGGHILERNFRSARGEIDIIVRDGKYTVFTEVKYRSGKRYGAPEEAVDYRKQRIICRCADYYRTKYKMDDFTAIRFDVIAISADTNGAIRVRWIKDAFPYHR